MIDTFDVDKAILRALTDDVKVAGLVGTRIYRRLKQNLTFPFVRMTVTGGVEARWFGTLKTEAWLYAPDFAAFSQSLSSEEAADIAQAIGNVLIDPANLTAGATAAGVSGIAFVMSRPGVFVSDYDESNGTWSAAVTYEVLIQEI